MATSGFTRREFTMAIAGGAVLAANQPSPSFGQDSASDRDGSKQAPSSDKKVSGKDDSPKKKPADEEPPEPPPEAAYLIGLITRRYPDERLDEVAVTGIVRDIYGDLARGRALSRYPLENSDEPGFVFQAWRAD
jgi:hypothetical protein